MEGSVGAPAAGEGRRPRDLRADFFRGIALWFIFIDHIPDNWLGHATLRNVALCDATEAFVLLAGYAAGIAYGGVLDREGWLFAAAQVVRRVGTLYVAHIVLFVMFTAQVGYSAAAMDASIYIDELHLDAFGDQPYRALLEALLLRFQPAFLNILPLYILLLLQFALVLPLVRRPRLLLALSLGLYAATRLLELELPTWAGGGWFFNPRRLAAPLHGRGGPRLPAARRCPGAAAAALAALGGRALRGLAGPRLRAALPCLAPAGPRPGGAPAGSRAC